jgi:hypothetical protein
MARKKAGTMTREKCRYKCRDKLYQRPLRYPVKMAYPLRKHHNKHS